MKRHMEQSQNNTMNEEVHGTVTKQHHQPRDTWNSHKTTPRMKKCMEHSQKSTMDEEIHGTVTKQHHA